MASGRRGQSEITLGAAHVAGMFLVVVVLCGIFFTLGYVMGRGNSAGKSSASGPGSAALDAGGNRAAGNRAPAAGWNFFPNKSSSSRASAGRPVSDVSSRAAARAPAGPISMSPKPAGVRIERRPPRLPDGREGVLLQVAAMENRTDALALVGFLQRKGYPAFAWGPASDRLYRVQVGPYPSPKAAGAMRKKLEKAGFQSILKR